MNQEVIMKSGKQIYFLVIIIILISVLATSTGIFFRKGPGEYNYESIRGRTVTIYGHGLYRHMSAEVAIQGIAQDYITLFFGIPLLIIALIGTARGSLRCRFLLAGTLGYFFVTYLFYTTMGMYNIMFLGYVILLAASFFALILVLLSVVPAELPRLFTTGTPAKFAGGFLLFNAFAIALLWLSIIIPPLLDGSLYPEELEHYTTLIVQGLDLGLLLPMAGVSAWLLIRKKPLGFLFGTSYLIFLSLLMTALTAKLVAMAAQGVNVVPAIFLIPVFNLTAVICSLLLLKSIKGTAGEK